MALKKSLVLFLLLFVFVEFNSGQVKWVNKTGLYELSSKEKPFFIFFKADWCNWCRQMELSSFKELNVYNFINENFIPVLINESDKFSFIKLRDKTFSAKEFAARTGVESYPSILITNDNLIEIKRVNGFLNTDELNILLTKVMEAVNEQY